MKVHVRLRKRLTLLLLSGAMGLSASPVSAWQLIDRFKDVSVGEWVKLKYTGGSEHLLLVAAKDDRTITLEEKIREEGYTTSWTQIVFDTKKKIPVLFREKMLLGGEIREIEFEEGKSGLDEEFQALLTAKFWEEPGKQTVIVPAGKFSCTEYRAIFNKKLVQIFFSDKIPLYPVKVLLPYYNLVIRLVDFGKGMKSNFSPTQSGPLETPPGESPPEECSPAIPENR